MDLLIDAHIHFWDPRARDHGWLDNLPELNRTFVPSDIEFGADVPDGLIFVEADRRSDQAVGEVDWINSIASDGVPIVGIVAHAPLELGAEVENLLEELTVRARVVGVRRLLQDEPPALLRAESLIEGTRLLAAYGLTSDLCVTMEQLPAVTRLVRACPGTTFVLDHLAKPSLAGGFPLTWAEELRDLAGCPNISCKLSGLATLTAPGWRPDDLLPYLQHAIDVFGSERCLFGSDWPVCLANTSYQQWLDVVLEAIDGLGPSERTAVLGANAVRIYGLGDLAARRGAPR